ncbi:Zinc finger C3H1 domain-containing protein [Borealophlyctis nickersoniae]|nr:Zinc finger C3H1 domain-containing protein [Borealophlyctis nickersoniae]
MLLLMERGFNDAALDLLGLEESVVLSLKAPLLPPIAMMPFAPLLMTNPPMGLVAQPLQEIMVTSSAQMQNGNTPVISLLETPPRCSSEPAEQLLQAEEIPQKQEEIPGEGGLTIQNVENQAHERQQHDQDADMARVPSDDQVSVPPSLDRASPMEVDTENINHMTVGVDRLSLEDERGGDMELDGEDGTMTKILVGSVWKTIKERSPTPPQSLVGASRSSYARALRPIRPSAAELNNSSTYNFDAPCLIADRPVNYVIDLDDSSDDEEPEKDIQPFAQPESATTAAAIEKRRKVLEEQMKAYQKLIAAKQRAKNQALPAGIAPPGPNAKQAPVEKPASDTLEQSKAKVGSVKAELKTAEAKALLLKKQQLESEITQLETELASAKRIASDDEANLMKVNKQMAENEKKVADAENTVTELEREMAELQARIAEAKAAVDAGGQQQQHLSSKGAVIKKQLVAHTKTVTELQSNLNAKRLSVVEIAKSIRLAASEAASGTKRNAITEETAMKRRKLTNLNGAGSPQPPNPTSEEGFIELPSSELDDFLSSAKKESVRRLRESHTAKSSPKVKGAADIVWEEEPTVEPLVVVGGYLTMESDICLVSDLYKSNLPVNGRWNCHTTPSVSKEGAKKDPQPNVDTPRRFTQYESPLAKFRTYRLNSAFDKELKSLTWSNKANPFLKFCRFELEGGRCFNDGCPGQHFRDLEMSDEEVLADLVEYAEAEGLNPRQMEQLRSRLQLLELIGKTMPALVQEVVKYLPENDHALRGERVMGVTLPLKRQRKYDGSEVDSTATEAAKATASAVDDNRAFHSPLNPPPRVPVLLSGLSSHLNGDDHGPTRYWDSPGTVAETADLLKENPKNVALWITHAASCLPSPLSLDALSKASTKVLNALSRGLEQNRTSEDLWIMYLEIYGRRETETEEEIREEFERAIGFLPGCLRLWWRWFSWEKTDGGKVRVLRKMLEAVLTGGSTMDVTTTSRSLLSAVLQLAKVCCDAGDIDDARRWLYTFLTAKSTSKIIDYDFASDASTDAPSPPIPKTLANGLLTKEDLAIGWLLYIHLLIFRRLPPETFYMYPHHYWVKIRLFEIRWGANGVWRESLDEAESVLHHLVSTWDSAATDDAKYPYVAILRNYCSFMVELREHSSREKVERVLREASIRFQASELCYLAVKLSREWNNYQNCITAIQKRIVRKQYEWPLWNALVKLSLQQGIADDILKALANCVRVCFQDMQPIDGILADNRQSIVEESLLLYKRVLALHVPDINAVEFKPDVKRTRLPCDPFLWFNYLILLSLRLSDDESPRDTREGFDQAVEALNDKEGRRILWRQYLQFETAIAPDGATVKDVKNTIAVLGRALLDSKPTSPHPFDGNACLDFVKSVPLKDMSFAHQILGMCLQALPAATRSDLIEYLRYNIPDVAFSPIGAKVLLEGKRKKQARLILHEAIKMDPHREILWRMYVYSETSLPACD